MVYGGGAIVFGAKSSNQLMQWTQYAVCSGIVVYGGGDIVFGAKRSNQRTQYSVDAVCSGIVVYGGGDIVFGAKRSTSGCSTQLMQYAVDAVLTQWTQWMQWMQLNSGIWWCVRCVLHSGHPLV